MTRHLRIAGWLVVVGWLGAVQAQTTSSLTGRVLDPSGVAVDGATIRARNTQSGAMATAVSAGGGKFALAGLVPGVYDVQMSGVPAMSNSEQKNITVGEKPVVMDLRMEFNTQLGTLGKTA